MEQVDLPDASLPSEICDPEIDPQDSLHENAPTCRICFLSEAESPELPPLISPCKCRGSMKYVHSACAEQWRRASPTTRDLFKCGHCGSSYFFRRHWAYVFKYSGSAYFRSLVATISYLGFTILVSQVVEILLPPPNQVGSSLFSPGREFSRVLRSAVGSFVWGKMVLEEDWRLLFQYQHGDTLRPLVHRILVGAVILGMFELINIIAIVRSRKLAVFIPMHFLISTYFVKQDGGRIDNWMKSCSMVFVAIGITRSIVRFSLGARSLAKVIQLRAIKEVVDRDDVQASTLL